jgi:branched-chain amino acid transport system substrate-binding protein
VKGSSGRVGFSFAVAAVAAGVAAAAVFGHGQERPQPIRIGLLVSLTGDTDLIAPQQVAGARLAIRQLNAAGGVDGAPVQLVISDDRLDPETGVAAMRRLIAHDRVAGVLGPGRSVVAVAADPVADRLHTPVVAISNTADGIVGRCPYPCTYIWRVSLGESTAVRANVEAYVALKRPSTAAILYIDDKLGTDEARIAQRTFQVGGVRVIARSTLAKDVSPAGAVRRVLATKPDALFVGGTTTSTIVQAIEAARAQGFAGGILGGNPLNGTAATKRLGRAGAGARSGSAWFLGNDFPANARFIQAFRQSYHEDPDQFAAQSYTAIQVVAEALRLGHVTGSEPPAEQRRLLDENLQKVALLTPLGPFRFDSDHDVRQIVWITEMDGRGSHRLVDFCNPGC